MQIPMLAREARETVLSSGARDVWHFPMLSILEVDV
jgi:hypothetical protein